MEEADALADYIVIMEEGQVHSETQGTPFDLKKRYSRFYMFMFKLVLKSTYFQKLATI